MRPLCWTEPSVLQPIIPTLGTQHKVRLPWWLSGKESAYQCRLRFQSLGWEDSPEKEMATLSISLAWEIPWTGEPGGLQSMGSQKSQTGI